MTTQNQPKRASSAEIAAYCKTPEADVDMLAEMMPEERSEYVYMKLHPEEQPPPMTEEEMIAAMKDASSEDEFGG